MGARAWVVPGQTITTHGNTDNTSHRAAVRTRFFLEIRATADGRPGAPGHHEVVARCPNWLRVVCELAGANDELSDRLPAEIQLPVWIGAESRLITDIDIATACAELEAHREVAREWWKATEAPLAGARAVASLPRRGARAARGLGRGWRDLVSDLKGLGAGPPDPDVVRATPRDPVREEQIRRTAQQLRFRLERDPRQWQQQRANVEMITDSQVANARAGVITPGDLEEWLILSTVSGVMSEDEAAAVRARVAAPLDGEPPPPPHGG